MVTSDICKRVQITK